MAFSSVKDWGENLSTILDGMKMIEILRKAGLGFVAALFLTSGTCHFLLTRFFVAIMPPYLPLHREAVYVSGIFELLGGLGLLFPSTRRAAGIGLFALAILVTPANVHMWLNPELFPGFSQTLLFWRLPAQAALLAIIWFCAIAPDAKTQKAQ
jgi:uncharacterized membrane protein